MSALVNGDRKVPWATELGTIAPLAPLKYEVTINARALPETTAPDRLLRYIDIGSVDSLGKVATVEEFTFGDAPSRARRLPRAGDTIVSTVRTYLRAISYIETGYPSLVCSTGFAVVTPGKRLHPRYLAHWMRSDPVVDEICARSTGVSYPAINASEIGCLPVPMLTIEKQRAIANFLDRKTAAIDALIAKKERFIELLQEKRQALITQAVTKGLDPNVPMKESRSEWLGDIPAHWATSQPKHLCSLIVDGPHVKPEYVDEGIPFVTVKNLTNGPGIDFTDLNYISHSLHAQLVRRGRPERGDVLLSKDGATLGIPRVVETDLVFSIFVSVALLKPRRHLVDSYFLRYVLEAEPTWQQFKGGEAGSAIKHIVLGTIGNVRIALPPLDEQRAIGSRLALLDENIAKTQALLQRHVERLREYRQALITAAVTGKIDVSNEAA